MTRQLISYIAPAAPATRRPAEGSEPAMRPEIGFTPAWYRQAVHIDFDERWHTDPAMRRDGLERIGKHLRERFPGVPIGSHGDDDAPPDLLTGTFGGCTVAAIYGVEILYTRDGWPTCPAGRLSNEQADHLEPPDLDANPFFARLMTQVDWIAEHVGPVHGYINWQGVLNTAYRLRGEALFSDMLLEPERARNVFACVAQTMHDGARRLYARQAETGVVVEHFTVSNCLVNMVSPKQYAEMLLEHDRRFAEAFGLLGVHNCAWSADPYMSHYATLPNVGYIDMGIESDLAAAKRALPDARRAVMVTPMDLTNKPGTALRQDFERIAREYAPCDMVLADIDVETPDERVMLAVRLCEALSG